jgi:hypothetical protein
MKVAKDVRNVVANDGHVYNVVVGGDVGQVRDIRLWPFSYKVAFACTTVLLVLGFTILTVAEKTGNKIEGPNRTSVEALDKTQIALIQVGVLISIVFLIGVGVPWFLTQRRYMRNQNLRIAEQLKTQQELRHEALEKLKKTTELATLMELNQGQIDTYHRIVTEQADKSFKSSRMAMNIGMILLVCAAFAVAYVPVDQVRWFIGALAAFSTLLSGYLTKTYLAMYKESIGQLNRYFDQPVLNSFYLTAERLTAGLDSDHAQEVRCQIINEVLATSARRRSRAAESKVPKPKPKKRTPKKQTSSVNGTPQV